MSPWWGLGVFLLPMFFFPLYFLKRRPLGSSDNSEFIVLGLENNTVEVPLTSADTPKIGPMSNFPLDGWLLRMLMIMGYVISSLSVLIIAGIIAGPAVKRL